MSYIYILYIIGAVAVGFPVGLYLIGQRKFDAGQLLAKAEKALDSAHAESGKLLNAAREHAEEQKRQFEIEQKEFMSQLERMEKIFSVKHNAQQKREARINELKKAIQEEENTARALQAKNNEMEKRTEEELFRIIGLSREHIVSDLFEYYDQEFQKDAEARLAHAAEWSTENALRDARSTLAGAMYRFTDATSVEHEGSAVIVPRDEIKGRIIGRGGRVVAFFENLFNVDVIFNDEPNTIIVSCFNLVQREIARLALERLIHEKNINEEVITRIKLLAENDMDKLLRREGEQALLRLNLPNMPPDFAKLVGRLKFRTSYGQNIMLHCFEVGYFARLMACEIGADPIIALLGGFFHDIGKAIDQEVGGSHDVLSKEILEKYGFSWEITHAAWTHHNAIPQETIEARIVQAADALSASRPGARAESVERYLEKMTDLRETALSFDGVKKAYAINAGRELRAIIEPEKISDKDLTPLASEIAAKVQEKGGYPGRIKIVTIRTTKVTDYAR